MLFCKLIAQVNWIVSKHTVIQHQVRMTSSIAKFLNVNLWDSDPELFDIIKNEKKRQIHGLEMIASENFTTLPVLQCLSSCLHNKYSEGLPGQRYVSHIQRIFSCI